MLRALRAVPALLPVLLLGCSTTASDGGDALGARRSAIVGGTPDKTHPAVVALFSKLNDTLCTGTVIAADANDGWALTAAHCVSEAGDASHVVSVGDDFNHPTVEFVIDQISVHPLYQPVTTGSPSPYDFAILRFPLGGKKAPTPIPAMTPDVDSGTNALLPGDALVFLGYGTVDPSNPHDMNTIRNQVGGTIQSVTSALVSYGQPTGGPCLGDSGGPALSTVNGVEYVSAVTSYGDAGCVQYGKSGRVSAVWADFIQPALAGMPVNVIDPDVGLGGAGGAGGAGPTVSPACKACQSSTQTTACKASVDDCNGDADCVAFEKCVNACPAVASNKVDVCYNACVFGHPEGASKNQAFFNCVCQTGCTTECAGVCTQKCGGLGYQDPTCEACFQTSCCDQAAACVTDAVCTACATSAINDPTCASNDAYLALSGCIGGTCKAACTPSSGAGGSGGSGSTPPVTTDSGGCTVEGSSSPGGAGSATLALLALALVTRRRRT